MDELQQQKEIELFKNSFKEDESWQPQNKNAILASKYKHRLTRKQFWPRIILCAVLIAAVQLLFQHLFDQLPTIEDYHSLYLYRAEIMPKKYGYLFLEFFLLAPLVYWNVWLQAGRLHDVGKSAGTIWWRVIPLAGDIYLTYLFCKPTPTVHQRNKQVKTPKISAQSIAKYIYWIALYLSLLFFSLLPLLCTSVALYPSECRTYFFLTCTSILSVFLSVAFCFRDKNPLYDFSLIKKEKQHSLSAGNFFFHSILSSISFVLIICFYYFRIEVKYPGSLRKMFVGTFYTTFLIQSEQFWADIAGTVAIVSTLLYVSFWITLRVLRLRSINLTFSQKIVFFIPIIGDIYHIYLLCRSFSLTCQVDEINQRITFWKNVSIILSGVLAILGIVFHFTLTSLESKLDSVPSYQLADLNALQSQYSECITAIYIILSIFVLFIVISFWFLFKAINDARYAKINPQSIKSIQTECIIKTTQPSIIDKETATTTVTSECGVTSEGVQRRIDVPTPIRDAESDAKESELLAAYRAHPELQAGIDALLGISNQDANTEQK